jgi:hypothetical protein
MTKKRSATGPGRKAGTGKLFGSLAAVALVGVVGFVGTQAAISDTTDNPGNSFNAGTIDLVDNDAETYMYQVNNVQPGDSIDRCIRVSYSGTLDSTVKLFMTTPLDTLAPYVDMTIEAGTQASGSFPSCTGFSSAGNIYTGTLANFQTTHPAAATGLAYSPNGVGTPWNDTDSVVYRVTLTLQNTARDPGEDFSGTHTYSWQADTV